MRLISSSGRYGKGRLLDEGKRTSLPGGPVLWRSRVRRLLGKLEAKAIRKSSRRQEKSYAAMACCYNPAKNSAVLANFLQLIFRDSGQIFLIHPSFAYQSSEDSEQDRVAIVVLFPNVLFLFGQIIMNLPNSGRIIAFSSHFANILQNSSALTIISGLKCAAGDLLFRL